jgi:DNA-directed RNA polymerase specialized sigma24 family protein
MQALAQRLAPAVTAPRSNLVALAGGDPYGLPRLSWRWLIQIRMGDEEARRTFLEAWGPVIDQEVHRYASKGGDPDELAAEGNLAVWEGALEYAPHRHRTTPERYIANRLHKRVRQRYLEEAGYTRPVRAVELDLVEPASRCEEGFVAVEQQIDLASAVGALSPGEQAAFERYLRLVEAGHGPDEAARILAHQEGGSFAAWKKRLERTRRKVRTKLQ